MLRSSLAAQHERAASFHRQTLPQPRFRCHRLRPMASSFSHLQYTRSLPLLVGGKLRPLFTWCNRLLYFCAPRRSPSVPPFALQPLSLLNATDGVYNSTFLQSLAFGVLQHGRLSLLCLWFGVPSLYSSIFFYRIFSLAFISCFRFNFFPWQFFETTWFVSCFALLYSVAALLTILVAYRFSLGSTTKRRFLCFFFLCAFLGFAYFLVFSFERCCLPSPSRFSFLQLQWQFHSSHFQRFVATSAAMRFLFGVYIFSMRRLFRMAPSVRFFLLMVQSSTAFSCFFCGVFLCTPGVGGG